MLYVLACLFAGYAHLLAIMRLVYKHRNEIIKWEVVRSGVLHVISVTFLMFAALFSIGFLNEPEAGCTNTNPFCSWTFSQMSYNYVVPAFFLFGLSTIGIFGLKLWESISQYKNNANHGGLRFGMVIWSVMAGAYISAAPLDHWWFFRDHQNSGYGMPGILGVKDIPCPGFAFFRTDAKTAHYRCPDIALGGISREWPFSPWPSYQEGESRELKVAIDKLKNEANNKIKRENGN